MLLSEVLDVVSVPVGGTKSGLAVSAGVNWLATVFVQSVAILEACGLIAS